MPITINEVARDAGVSKSTVSRYLNGRYENMSAETRERIAAVIAALDYRPNALARSLKQKRTHTIGAIVANILNPFSTSVIRGVEDYCKGAGFNLILCNADEDPLKEKEYIEMLTAKQIDGLIINTTGRNNDFIETVRKELPVVLIDRKVPEISLDTVTVNNFHGASLAVDHLFRLGHRRIALFTLPYEAISPRAERVRGFREALGTHGIEFCPEFLVQTELHQETIAEKIRQMMAQDQRPTAIFGTNNLMTMGLIKALKRLSIRIPQDIAVIGFDDWDWAELIDPPVTVISQPTYDIGFQAASLLIKRIKSKKRPRTPSMIEYPPLLVVRKSCGE